MWIQVQSKSKIFKSLQQAIKSGRKNWQLAVDEAKQAVSLSRYDSEIKKHFVKNETHDFVIIIQEWTFGVI